jgi:hypothetical protein
MYNYNPYALHYQNPYLRSNTQQQNTIQTNLGDNSGIIFEGDTSYTWNRKTMPELENIS